MRFRRALGVLRTVNGVLLRLQSDRADFRGRFWHRATDQGDADVRDMSCLGAQLHIHRPAASISALLC